LSKVRYYQTVTGEKDKEMEALVTGESSFFSSTIPGDAAKIAI